MSPESDFLDEINRTAEDVKWDLAVAVATLRHTPCCGASCTESFPPRCRACGHRFAIPKLYTPRETRTQPPWTWPGEIIGRWMARRPFSR